MIDEFTERELIQELQQLLREDEGEALEIFLRLIRPEDIAQWLDDLTVDERKRVVSALDHEAAGTVLDGAAAPIRAELVGEIGPRRLARIVEALPPDEGADIIGALERADSERVLQHVSNEDEAVIRHLLTFPEDSAGGLMNPKLVALQPTATVDDAISYLRTAADDTVTAAAYVVDEQRRLIGYVRLRRLVTARVARLLADVMETDVISVTVNADQEEVADLVDRYGFMAVPVVDDRGRLLGAVTVDDVLEVIEDEATEDIYKMAGSSVEEEESTSILHVARYRLPWLLVCLAGTQLSSMVLVRAAREISLYSQLSVFTAAIMAMAGNTSLQSSTTTVRRLALDSLPRSRFMAHVGREIAVALVMGVLCGAIASALALVFHHDPLVGLALGPAMAVAMSAASLLGSAMPIVLDLVDVDPAVASGPLVSTINDSLALVVYFVIATRLMLWLV